MIRHSEYDCHDGEENQRYTKEVMVERVRDINSGENMLVQGSGKLQLPFFFLQIKLYWNLIATSICLHIAYGCLSRCSGRTE